MYLRCVRQVVLLDHIPHWDDAAPMPYVQSTYVPYKISVYIPDIQCKQVREEEEGRKEGRKGGVGHEEEFVTSGLETAWKLSG